MIPASHGRLEANLRPAEGERRGLAVVCHPHPQHGGTMHTKAVFRAAQALSSVGFDTLRFNFRGVGSSTGSYDRGEGEKEDARSALDWCEKHAPGLPILLGGFSFGARVALDVGLSDPRPKALFGLGLPLDMYDFHFLDGVQRPVLLVQGERDEYGGGESLERLARRIDGAITTRVIQGTDHYFNGRFEELQAAVREYFTRGPGAAPFRPEPDPRDKEAESAGPQEDSR